MERNLENPTPGSNSQTFCLQNDYSKFQSLDYNCLLQIICVCTLCVLLTFKPQNSEILKNNSICQIPFVEKIKYFGKNCGFPLCACTNVVGRISGLKGKKNQGFRSGYVCKKVGFYKK